MRSRKAMSRTARCGGALCALCLSLPALATPPDDAVPSAAGTSLQSDAPVDAPSAFGHPLDADALGRFRGGADTVENNVDIHGNVGGNTASDIVTGDNIIDGGAFANSAGISTVIQNSGANVLIQNGTVVNIQFLPPGP